MKSNSSTNPNRKLPGKAAEGQAVSNFRSKGTINRLNMYNDKPDYEGMNKQSLKPARIQPDRKYFGPVRTIN